MNSDLTDDPCPIDRDTLFTAASHRYRRYILSFLCDQCASATHTDVVYAVAEQETGQALADIPTDTCKQLYIALHHIHLPHLADAGLIAVNREADQIALTPRAERHRSLLISITEDDEKSPAHRP